jgi:hypothetical protein
MNVSTEKQLCALSLRNAQRQTFQNRLFVDTVFSQAKFGL